MNKVVNIEIAGQVFWINEEAYKKLTQYLIEIQQQLNNEDSADEIYQDIELRVAELLYAINSDKQRSIDLLQVDTVIKRVGYIDSDEVIQDSPIQKKSHLDEHNKILGGVCAGLAVRFGVPAFIIRLLFIGLTAVFGLGLILYFIFWFSLDKNTTRKAALAAEGKAQTAQQIASYNQPKRNPLAQLQRILFLPFSLLGALISVFTKHFYDNKGAYFSLAKLLCTTAVLACALLVFTGIIGFNTAYYYSRTISWLLSIAAMYLVILALFIYFRRYYFTKPYKTLNRALTVGAIVPIIMIGYALIHLNYIVSERKENLIEKSFNISNEKLTLVFDETPIDSGYYDTVNYQLKVIQSDKRQVKLFINSVSYGANPQEANSNQDVMNYSYAFKNNTLKLNRYWSLNPDALNRGQFMNVIIEVPDNIIINSTSSLKVYPDGDGYIYSANQRFSKGTKYFTMNGYLHEYEKTYENRLSNNEVEIFRDIFCETFFLSKSWDCLSNIRQTVNKNSRLDQVFNQSYQQINTLRKHLLPDRSIVINNLEEMKTIVGQLNNRYAVVNELQNYINHLITIKSLSKSMLDNDTS